MGRTKKTVEEVAAVDANEREQLVTMLADSLNAMQKGPKIAFVLSQDKFVPADVPGWVSTGADMLDLAISNIPHGGLPFGRVVEIVGFESSGKSLLALHIAKSTQAQGGVVVYLDTEASMNRQFATAVGVDISAMAYSQPDYLEQVYESVDKVIEKVRSVNSDKPVTIIVDTIMATPSKAELEGNFDKEGWNTAKAIINSKAMRKLTNKVAKEKILLLFLNQLRDKLGVSFGDNSTTSGGHAIKFHSSVRIRLKQAGQIKGKLNGVEQVIGNKVIATVIKSKIGPPLRKAEFNVYYESGIDNAGSWVQTLDDYDIVKREGKSPKKSTDDDTKKSSKYTYTTDAGEVIEFKAKTFKDAILSNPELKDELYKKICDKVIMGYKTDKLDDADISITNESEEEG
jgi:recombination protein RecA